MSRENFCDDCGAPAKNLAARRCDSCEHGRDRVPGKTFWWVPEFIFDPPCGAPLYARRGDVLATTTDIHQARHFINHDLCDSWIEEHHRGKWKWIDANFTVEAREHAIENPVLPDPPPLFPAIKTAEDLIAEARVQAFADVAQWLIVRARRWPSYSVPHCALGQAAEALLAGKGP